jgi:hypothetical protein
MHFDSDATDNNRLVEKQAHKPGWRLGQDGNARSVRCKIQSRRWQSSAFSKERRNHQRGSHKVRATRWKFAAMFFGPDQLVALEFAVRLVFHPRGNGRLGFGKMRGARLSHLAKCYPSDYDCHCPSPL